MARIRLNRKRLPFPFSDLRHILAILGNIFPVLDEFGSDGLFRIGRYQSQLGDAVDHIRDEVEAVQIIAHDHVEGRGGGPLLLIAAHMEICVVRPAVR